jgi:predicted nicotinamide N-methyase
LNKYISCACHSTKCCLVTDYSQNKGFVMWPSAVILARHLIKNPSLIQNSTVLELGSGCGLTGLVAAAIGAKSVIQTDYNDVVLENLKANALLNTDVTCTVTTSRLDFYLQSGDSVSGGWYESYSNEKDTSSNCKIRKKPVSVVLAADVICKPTDAIAVSKTIFDCLVPGGKAYVLCGNVKHRFGVDMFEGACQNIGLRVTTTVLSSDENDNNKVNDDSRDIDSLLNFCSGYVKEMDFLLFELTKPSTFGTNRTKQ